MEGQRACRQRDGEEEPVTTSCSTTTLVSVANLGRRQAMQRVAVLPAVFSPAMAWTAVKERAEATPGYGKDPRLKSAQAPWPRILTARERVMLAEAADFVLPTDASGPGAVELGVVDFLDEWLSAPYPKQQEDLLLIREGLKALAETGEGRRVAGLLMNTEAADGTGAALAHRIRALVLIGWGTTPQASAQLGFVGNEPRARFEGPPADVLALLRERAEATNSRIL